MSTANEDAWMSDNSDNFDNSDIDLDEAGPPLSIFDGLKKGFLLDKAKRKNNAGPSQRHQSEPPRTQKAPVIHLNSTPKVPAKRTLRQKVLDELGKLTGEYGPASGEGTSPIPWIEISGFFHKVEQLLL
jgi:hypothetical protein